MAAGKGGAVLHYIKNDQPLPENKSDMMLIDAGCEYHLYASDITRTFPINGKFEGDWKTTYEIVLASQKVLSLFAIPVIKMIQGGP